jgi:hypothetical protein
MMIKNRFVLLITIIILTNISNVMALDTVWVVVADQQVDNKNSKCIGSYSMIEDYPGMYDFFEDATDEEIMISKYIVLADEVMAFVDCHYMTEFQSIPFTTDKEFLYMDLRYRDTSGLWFMIGVDGGDYQLVNEPWEKENCIERSQDIVSVDNFLAAQGLNDGKQHVINVKLIDYDGYCPDAAQIWFPTKIVESNKEKTQRTSTKDGLGVSIGKITAEIIGNLNYLFIDPYKGEEDEDYTSEIGRIYGYSNVEKEMGQLEFEKYIENLKKNPKNVQSLLNNPKGININDLKDKEGDTKSEEKMTECEYDEVLTNGRCVYKCEFDELWTGKDCVREKIIPNEFQVFYEDDKKVIRFKNSNGNERWTTDGKHFYKSKTEAMNPGAINNIKNTGSAVVKGVKGFFFATKFKDEDRQLKREVSNSVLEEFKKEGKNDEFDKYKEKLTELSGLFVPKYVNDLVSVPADSIIEFSKEADKTEFNQGVEIYIEERESGRSIDNIYDSPPEELVYGGLKGVGMNINAQYPKSLLYSKYEEAYQRYKILKEIG